MRLGIIALHKSGPKFSHFKSQAAHGIGGSILYHALYTSTDYVAPTHLLPFTQWVGLYSFVS